jgi:hypothetical protein
MLAYDTVLVALKGLSTIFPMVVGMRKQRKCQPKSRENGHNFASIFSFLANQAGGFPRTGKSLW